MAVRSFSGFRPSPRYDDVPWNRIRIMEAPDVDDAPGSFTTIDTIALSPLDADPERPTARNVTTDDATLETGWYKLVFLDASDNEDPSDPVKYPGSGYPSPSELVAESEVDALTGLAFEFQEALYIGSKLSIEEFCGQAFDYERNRTRVFDGSGERKVYLPKRLENLEELEVAYSSLAISDVSLGEDKNFLLVESGAGLRNYYERALMQVSDNPSLLFTAGAGTITITGDWGWADFPAAVRVAMRYDMEDQALGDANALSDSLRAFQKLGMRDVRQGNLNAVVTSVSGLSDRVRQLLQPYVWTGKTGAVL